MNSRKGLSKTSIELKHQQRAVDHGWKDVQSKGRNGRVEESVIGGWTDIVVKDDTELFWNW